MIDRLALYAITGSNVVKNMVDTGNQQKAPSSNLAQKAKARSPLLIIFFTVLIDLIGFGLIIPILPSYARGLDAEGFTLGLLIASYSLMQFLCMPFWGRLSDHVGRRPILLISLAASATGYLIWGFSNSLWMLFLARIVAGAGNANIAVAQAYVSDVTTPENRAKGMGLIGAAFGLGFVLGPALGGLFLGSDAIALLRAFVPTASSDNTLAGLQFVGFVACLFSLIDLILAFFLLPEPEKRSHAGTDRFDLKPGFVMDTLKDKNLSTSIAIFFLSTFAFANMEATLVLLTNDRFGLTPRQNSLLFVFVGVLIVLIQGGLIHRLAKKYGEKILIEAGTILTGFGLFLTPLTLSFPVLCAAVTLLAFGSSINTPSNQSMLSKLAPQERSGGILGIGQSVSTLGRIFGPLVGCACYKHFGIPVPYMIGTVAMVVAFLLSLQLPKMVAASKS
jgi:MFS transporter, DHA1 family, tetracycline resistance protein